MAALANPLNFDGARGAFVIRARVEVEAARWPTATVGASRGLLAGGLLRTCTGAETTRAPPRPPRPRTPRIPDPPGAATAAGTPDARFLLRTPSSCSPDADVAEEGRFTDGRIGEIAPSRARRPCPFTAFASACASPSAMASGFRGESCESVSGPSSRGTEISGCTAERSRILRSASRAGETRGSGSESTTIRFSAAASPSRASAGLEVAVIR